MGFRLEFEMSVPVRHWLNRERLLVKDEFVVPWGICDFVGLSFDTARVKKRLEYGQHRPIGSLHRIALLGQIPEQESGKFVTLRKLKKQVCSFQAPRIENELQRLIDDRFVVRNTNGSFQKLNGWAPLHSRIVAVELKLSRISEVLAQAASHRAFASESYIAMPAEIAKPLANSTRAFEFRASGVGILAVTCTTCKVVFPSCPQGVDVDPVLQMHCSERFWRTKGSSS